MANESLNTRAQLLLASFIGQMSASMQLAAKERKLKYADQVYYKRFKLPVSASGLQNILLNDDSQKDGFCNISKQKINQGCAFVANRFTFKVSYVDGSQGGAPTYAQVSEGSSAYSAVSQNVTSLPALGCAELEFTVNGDTQFCVPVNAFNHETMYANSDKDGLNVESPIFINDERLMQFRLKMPQGVSLAATDFVCVEVAMYGAECRIVG